jgi:uncharacterized protein (TIRG00374 family)
MLACGANFSVTRITSGLLLRLLLVGLLLAALVTLAARTLDLAELWEILRAARWGFLIPSTVLNIITVGVIVLRWQFLLNRRAAYLDCFTSNQVGAYLNNLLPLRMGDFTRSYLLRRRYPSLSMAAILASIGAELTFDMSVLMVLMALVLVVLPLPSLLTSAGALLAVLTVIAAAGVLSMARSDFFPRRVLRPLAERLLPERFQAGVGSLLERAQDGLVALKSNRQLVIILGYTTLGFAIQVLSNWLLLNAFLDDVALHAGLVALVGAGIGLALPLLPGSAGTYELAVALALSSIGIEPEVAAAFALVLHAQQVSVTLVTGSLSMLREGVSLQEIRRAADADIT